MEEFGVLSEVLKERRYEAVIASLKKDISSATNLDEALVRALNKVVDMVSAQAGTLWFFDRFQRGIIYPRAVYGGGDIANIVLKPGEGIAGQVIKYGDGAIIKNCQQDSRWAGKVDSATGFKTISMMCVPLKWHQYAFGCIQIINKTDGNTYDDKDFQMATNLANAISKAFEESGVLSDYTETDTPVDNHEVVAQTKEEMSLNKAFHLSEFDDLEKAMYNNITGFSDLSDRNRKDILRHMREVYLICNKSGLINK